MIDCILMRHTTRERTGVLLHSAWSFAVLLHSHLSCCNNEEGFIGQAASSPVLCVDGAFMTIVLAL